MPMDTSWPPLSTWWRCMRLSVPGTRTLTASTNNVDTNHCSASQNGKTRRQLQRRNVQQGPPQTGVPGNIRTKAQHKRGPRRHQDKSTTFKRTHPTQKNGPHHCWHFLHQMCTKKWVSYELHLPPNTNIQKQYTKCTCPLPYNNQLSNSVWTACEEQICMNISRQVM